MSDAIDKQIIDEVVAVLLDRKGFGWWWEEIGSVNRASIKRQARAAIRKTLAAAVPEGTSGVEQ